MKKTKKRNFALDGDICEVVFVFNDKLNKYFGSYPDFEDTPRFTKSGMRWVSVTQDACSYARSNDKSSPCLDCGSCIHMLREKEGDLIGVCKHHKRKKRPTSNTARQTLPQEEKQ